MSCSKRSCGSSRSVRATSIRFAASTSIAYSSAGAAYGRARSPRTDLILAASSSINAGTIWKPLRDLLGPRSRGRIAFNLALQLNHTVQQGLRRGRTARHVDIHRYDAIAAADHGIGIVVVAAAIGAGTHRDHPAWLGHLVVDLAQCRRHLIHQGAGHDHDVGLTWTRTEDHAKTIQVVARSAGVHH